MVSAASKALELYEKNPNVEIEEAIKIVLNTLDATRESKIPAVAAVNGVLKMKRASPGISDKQIIQKFISDNKGLAEPIDEI